MTEETKPTMSERVTAGVKAMTPAPMSGDNFFGRNKQKLLGLATITIGYLQLPANVEVIKAFVSPGAFAFITMGIGLAALWFGFLNNPEKEG